MAVTIIEVALIVTLMVSGGDKSATLARDTVFAAVIITTNGIVGLSLLIGSLRYGVMLFNANGSGAALATVTTLATLSLVLPTFTTSQPGPSFRPASSASPRSRRSGSICCSCSPRPCDTAISFCRSANAAPP
ncbi:putative ionic transporter integral membrane protein ChaA [Mycobacterium xenopi 3993]|nr:putative ionic transporter integral membrane protein ChaA [Mycobacterium xenopi 3993]